MAARNHAENGRDLRSPALHLVAIGLVRAAFLAAADLEAWLRLRAADFACFESARCDAAERGLRFSALVVARERLAEIFLPPVLPLAKSCFACFRTLAE